MSAPAKESDRGYRGPALEVMRSHGVGVWCEVRAETTRGAFEGLILPRSETSDELHVVLKLGTGYNIGIRCDTITGLEKIGYREGHYGIPEKAFPTNPGYPNVKLLGTGGTIASRLDYRTGAVIPAFSPGELYGSVPELADLCNLETEKVFGVFSENMGPEQYLVLAEKVGEAIREGYDGIVIGHGTDTMHHTAAALSFMVQRPPVPVVLVGSQRSSDRPSSDAARNLIAATRAAGHGTIAEVMVCMFGPTSDLYNLLHRGTRVRKMHSSVRSTFRTLGDIPLARVHEGEVVPIKDDWRPRRDDRNVEIHAVFDPRVTLAYYYPGMQPDVIDSLVDAGYHGIVIAGTGLGHVNRAIYPGTRARPRRRRAGVHDAPDALGLRPDARLRDRPRDPRARCRPPRQYAPRGRLHKARVGARHAPERPRGRPLPDDHPHRRRDHRARAPRRLPRSAGRRPRGGGIPQEGVAVSGSEATSKNSDHPGR